MPIKIKPLTNTEIIENVVEIISKHIPNARIILFGSRAKGTASKRSDFDIAIDIDENVPAKVKFQIEDEIDELPTLKMVDIVYLYEADHDFRKIVYRSGKIIYDGSKVSTE